MVDTVRAARRAGQAHAATAAALMATALVVSSAATLVLVALAGGFLPMHGFVIGVALVLALLAALGDAAGLRVRPQIPLQVPERWRRTLPLPLASVLYGTLLGTGLSSAVPAFAGWAVVLVAAALARPGAALLAGLALGIGRSLPILLAVEVASRPRGLRVLRAASAQALVLTVAAATGLAPAAAAQRIAQAVDPSAAGGELAWEQPGVGGILLRADGTTQQLPGHDPAVGGSLIAWHEGDTVTVADRATLQARFQEQIVGVHQLAISDEWLVLRQLQPDGTWRLIVQSIADTSVHRVIAQARLPTSMGRPAVDGSTVVYAVSSSRGSSIVAVSLPDGARSTVRTLRFGLLGNPSLVGGALLYDEIARCAQLLRLGALHARSGRALYRLPPLAGQDAGREPHHSREGSRTPCKAPVHPTTSMLWSTALAARAAYVAVLAQPRAGAIRASVLTIARR